MDDIEFRFLYLLQDLHTPLVDGLMTLITSLGDHGIFWLLLAAVLFAVPRTRLMGACMLVSIGIGFLLGNVALKNLIARDRPCWLDPTVQLLVQVPRDYSFPSGHTLVSFEGGVTIFMFNRKWGIPALMLAVLIAFSRMYLYVHYPTDVLGGVLVGILAGYGGYRVVKALEQYKKEK